MSMLEKLAEAMATLDEAVVLDLTTKLIDEKVDASMIIGSLTSGMQKAGERFSRGEYFLPELVMSAETMSKALEKVNPLLTSNASESKRLGTVVIGTVKGDVHDIGKNLVKSVLIVGGYKVIDLGVNVSNEMFVQKAQEHGANIIALSALLTTTMPQQQALIKYLEEKSLRDRFKVIVGGAPVTHDFAKSIGADGYSEDAFGALLEVNRLMGL